MESILKDCKKKVVLLENYFLAGDLKNYAIEAHSVKSVSASIGATTFSDLAKDNELKAKAEDRDYIEANGSYFITKYKEFLNSIEQILAEERQFEAEKQLEQATNAAQKPASYEDDNVSADTAVSEEELAKQKADIRKKLDKVIEAIDDFESDTALEILQSLRTPDTDPDFMEVLTKVSDLIDDFEYDEAVEILKKYI
jgi:hypothetical protein